MDLTPEMVATLKQISEMFDAPWSHKFMMIEKNLTSKKKEWLYENCEGKWEYNLVTTRLTFSNDADLALYKLTWL